MRTLHQRRFRCFLPIFALGAALLSREARAETLCTGLPPSRLKIFDSKAPDAEEIVVPGAELAERGPDGDLVSRHPFMLSFGRILTWFEIVHRVIPRTDGRVCDAPVRVQLGFGLDRRVVVMARSAADDACMRQAMLDHETAHARAFDEAVDDLINRHRDDIQRGVSALKATPAPDDAAAKARWETGLRALTAEIRRELLDELRAAYARTDAPDALAALAKSCGGRLGAFEHNDH